MQSCIAAALRTTLIHLADEEVGRPSRLLDQFLPTLILGRADLSRPSCAQSLQGLDQGLESWEGWDQILLKLCQRHTHKGSSTFLCPAPDSIHNSPDEDPDWWSWSGAQGIKPILNFFWLMIGVPLTPGNLVLFDSAQLSSAWLDSRYCRHRP